MDDVLQLLAQEDGDNGRRRLRRAETVVIARYRRGLPEKTGMLVHRFQDASQHQKKLDILVGCLSRIHHIDAVIRGQRPVIVLAGTVDSREGLLCQKAGEALVGRGPLHGLHHHLVMVAGDIGLLIYLRQLVLCRSHLVVLCL